MKHVRFAHPALAALEQADDSAYSTAVTKAFRLRLQAIRAAVDERDFYAMRSLHFEKLKGKRAHQRSMRLNDQFRLIVEFDGHGPNKTVVVVAIEDYH